MKLPCDRCRATAPALLLLLTACKLMDARAPGDMARGPDGPELGSGADLLQERRDLQPGADLLPTPPDLALADLTPPPDLYVPPKLAAPGCKGAMVTSNMVYGVAASACGGAGMCHLGAGMAGLLNLGMDGPSLRSAVVNVPASSALMQLVTPSDINQSYLLFKLTGQQSEVALGSGVQMPQGSTLSDKEICVFVDWVARGAR